MQSKQLIKLVGKSALNNEKVWFSLDSGFENYKCDAICQNQALLAEMRF